MIEIINKVEDYDIRIKFKKEEISLLDKMAKRIYETSKKEE